MRTLFTLCAALLCGGHAIGQGNPYLARVVADDVTVRSGPGEAMEDTGRLARGELVIVASESGERWLAVEPPRGQVSWVRTICLGESDATKSRPTPRNAVILCDGEIDIATGRAGTARPLNVRKTRVPDGTIVKVIGAAVAVGGEGWTPIEPVEGDYRYLPRSAVQMVKGHAAQNYTVNSPPAKAPPAPADGGTVPASSAAPPLPPGVAPSPGAPGVTVGRAKSEDWPAHPLWQQAEAAELARDYPRAERLYLQLAADMNQPGGDVGLANLCYTRVHGVREKQRSAGRPTPVEPTPNDARPGEKVAAGQWFGPGTVRLAGFRYEGRATYSLNVRGAVKLYLVAGVGVDLDKSRDSESEVYGAVSYPADLRGVGLMSVTRVQAPARRRE